MDLGWIPAAQAPLSQKGAVRYGDGATSWGCRISEPAPGRPAGEWIIGYNEGQGCPTEWRPFAPGEDAHPKYQRSQ